MVWKLYKQYAHSLARVVRGLPISWGSSLATVKHIDVVDMVAWSPCSKFIALYLCRSIEVLDAATFERLRTFMHPPSGSGWLSFSPDSRSLTWTNSKDNESATWDLQTGGQISATPSTLNPPPSSYFSSAYSMDGKIVARACRNLDDFAKTAISTYNLISGTHVYFHRVSEGRIVAEIWTHGEFLRFVTVKPGSITVWEVGFTSEHKLAEIESLPAPDDTGSGEHLFLPTLSRLAFILRGAVLIWDTQDSKFLLNSVDISQPGMLSFSSDGRFFACGSRGKGVYLWKESPTGYVLHQKLVLSEPVPYWMRPFPLSPIIPFLSPDGKSIVTSRSEDTQLRRITDSIDPPSDVPPQPAEQNDFVLAFSPDRSFIATGRLGGNIATIVDLKSGDPRLIIDVGMKICGLGVTGSTAIVIGEGKIITWNLPARDCVLDARANIHDSVRTIVFNHPPPLSIQPHIASISPDFGYLVITREVREGLDIYDMSTGKHIVGNTEHVSQPRFTRDGRQVDYGLGTQKIIRGEGSDIIGLEPPQFRSVPSGGYLYKSLHGYNVTDDGWIFDSRKKRVMWLPHHWRVHKNDRIWDERFLALFDYKLPEPVVIELYE